LIISPTWVVIFGSNVDSVRLAMIIRGDTERGMMCDCM
jgi:hypothetical protein